MKKAAQSSLPILSIILVLAMTSFSSGLLQAQDTLAKKPQKVIKIKVDADAAGESISIDTTYVIESDADMEKFQQAMMEYEIKMQGIEEHLKDLNIQLDEEEMEKALQEAQFDIQNACLESPKMRYLYRNLDKPCHKREFDWYGDRYIMARPGHRSGPVRIVSPEKGETLSDILGDIPMSAVKSYRVKETKDGKRITIDISDEALFDRPEEIIIIQGDVLPPPPPPPPPAEPKLKKEVLIQKEIEKEESPE